jgi:multisubunit Na+/H+ antiporter MnhG subunit
MKSDNKTITVEKCKDSGLALVLICLLCYQAWKLELFLVLAIIFLLVAMTYPLIFQPFARFWYALSTALGTVVSKIILTLLFITLVVPISLVRRAMGKDSMRIKIWKKGIESVFRVREHQFEAKDLEHPY